LNEERTRDEALGAVLLGIETGAEALGELLDE